MHLLDGQGDHCFFGGPARLMKNFTCVFCGIRKFSVFIFGIFPFSFSPISTYIGNNNTIL